MKYLPLIPLVASAMLVSCRSVRQAGESTAMVAGVTAMVAVSPAIPVVDAVRRIDGKVDRGLTVWQVYRAAPGVYVIPNVRGWFTDRSEERGSQSAWVIDLRTAARDKKGRIVLDWQNLHRWYFRDTDRSSLESIPAWKKDQTLAEYFKHEGGDPQFQLRVEGKTFVLIITQEKQGEQAPDNAG